MHAVSLLFITFSKVRPTQSAACSLCDAHASPFSAVQASLEAYDRDAIFKYICMNGLHCVLAFDIDSQYTDTFTVLGTDLASIFCPVIERPTRAIRSYAFLNLVERHLSVSCTV